MLLQNGAVSVSSLFNCNQQTRTLPEHMANYKVIPQLVSVHGAARPSGFYISNGSLDNAISIDSNTGQFYVSNSTALSYEYRNFYQLTVSGRQRSFDSGYACGVWAGKSIAGVVMPTRVFSFHASHPFVCS